MAKLLIVDDEAKIREVVKEYAMLMHEYEVEEAENGHVALQMVNQNDYDLIVLDIMMPVMDGIEATKVIREIEKRENKYTPIIAFTANTLNNDYHTCKSNGMDHLLEKPFSVSKFTQILEELDN